MKKIESIVIQSHDAAVEIIGSDPAKWRPRARPPTTASLHIVAAHGWRNHRAAVCSRAVRDPALLGLVQRGSRAQAGLSARYRSSWKHCHRAPARQPPAARTRGLSARPRRTRSATRNSMKFHSLADRRLGRSGRRPCWRLDGDSTRWTMPARSRDC